VQDKTSPFSFNSVHSALGDLRLCAISMYTLTLTLTYNVLIYNQPFRPTSSRSISGTIGQR